jgi:DNA-binding SARP family transcriptional activator
VARIPSAPAWERPGEQAWESQNAWHESATGDGLEIRILGHLEVLRDGRQQALPASRKVRGLLAYLALAVHSRRREELCDLLWEDVSDPRGELRWCLARLRAVLGPWLVSSQEGIGTARQNLTVDAVAFRRLAATICSEREAREALKLWRGEPVANAKVSASLRFHAW